MLTEAVTVSKNSRSPASKSNDLLRTKKAWWLLSKANFSLSFPPVMAYWTSEFGVLGLSRSVARIPRKMVKPRTKINTWQKWYVTWSSSLFLLIRFLLLLIWTTSAPRSLPCLLHSSILYTRSRLLSALSSRARYKQLPDQKPIIPMTFASLQLHRKLHIARRSVTVTVMNL